jgi:hypothetical protein
MSGLVSIHARAQFFPTRISSLAKPAVTAGGDLDAEALTQRASARWPWRPFSIREAQRKNRPLESGRKSLLGGQMPVGDGHTTTRRRTVSIALDPRERCGVSHYARRTCLIGVYRSDTASRDSFRVSCGSVSAFRDAIRGRSTPKRDTGRRDRRGGVDIPKVSESPCPVLTPHVMQENGTWRGRGSSAAIL